MACRYMGRHAPAAVRSAVEPKTLLETDAKELQKTFVKTFVKTLVKTLVKTFVKMVVKTQVSTFLKALCTREPAGTMQQPEEALARRGLDQR